MRSHGSQSHSRSHRLHIRPRPQQHRELLSHDAAGTIVTRPALLIQDQIALQSYCPHPRRLRSSHHRLLLHLLLTAGILHRQFIRGDFIHPLAMLRGDAMRLRQCHQRLGLQSQGKQTQSNEEMKARHSSHLRVLLQYDSEPAAGGITIG